VSRVVLDASAGVESVSSALRDNVTVADALDVVMARHPRAMLVTLDVSLANAPALGVETLVP
jgi:predicted nucleic acid-binding protein